MDIRDLGAMALTLAVAGIIISFTLLVMTEIDQEMCPGDDFYVTGYTNSPAANPVTSGYYGCCNTQNSTGGSTLNCTTWTTGSYAVNASFSSIEGVAQFSGWFTIIALAVVFAIILGIILRYIGGTTGRI
jgi:hypothetical protein